MAVAYQSVGTLISNNSGSTRAIPKPTGLAVGDLMIASIASILNAGTSVTLLSGWTSIYYSGDTTTTGISHRVAYKVADSGDVAASTFDWVCGGSNPTAGGAIWRISGQGSTVIIEASQGGSWSGTSASITGITATRTSDLYLILACGRTSDGDHTLADISGYAIATSNPTWTEAYDLVNTTGDACQIAGAYAIRPEITATGNYSFNSSESFNYGDAVIVAVANSLTVTVAPASLTALSFSLVAPTIKTGVRVVASAISATFSLGTNIVKRSINWFNEDKGSAITWETEDK